MHSEREHVSHPGHTLTAYCHLMGGRLAQRWEAIDLSLLYFLGAWTCIGLISAYDAYLVKLYRPVILAVERNPICSFLIACDPHELTLFFTAKSLGTATVLAVLVILYQHFRRLSLPVITGVAIFQFGLLMYLKMAPY